VHALAAEKNRPPPEIPPRLVESRREAFGLLWFPELTVDDAKKLVLTAVAGLPHCPKCLRPMKLSAKPPEEWVCDGCGDRRAGTAADFTVSDSVVTDALKEFFARRPNYGPGPALKMSKKVREAA
jgi:ribosomal protein L37AE/L43A